ncbi:MAG: transcription termination/antitermination protein NusA, partial [Methyloceanibacter sp.]
EHNIKTVEDLADCATDDLAGWSERKDKETVRHDGVLDGFGLARAQIEELILDARVKAGWIEAASLVPDPVEGEGEGEGEAATETEAGTEEQESGTSGASAS